MTIGIAAEEVIRNPNLQNEYWVSWELMCACCKRFSEPILEKVRQEVRVGKTVRQAAAQFKDFRLCCVNLLANPTVISLSGSEKYVGQICNVPYVKHRYNEDNENVDQVEAFLMGEQTIVEDKKEFVEEFDSIDGRIYIDPTLDMEGVVSWANVGVNTYTAN